MLPRHIAMMVMVQVLWGANFAIAKFGLDSFSPIFFVALRFSLVAILLVFIVGLPRRDKLLRLLPLSVTMGMITAFAGVLLIAGEPRFSDDPWPLLSVVGAAAAWAIANIQVKALGDEI